ncbi:MAG: Uma2 family endonuclease [Synechococcales cyanobacterium T60_A2020_003]|nr:Uma2 family endonuclease [Synechococcales cyanobacterium T60_A2020_003]
MPNTRIPTDTWITTSWEDYLRDVGDPAYANAKSYYYNHQVRVEMSPVGNDHASDHSIVIYAVTLFAAINGIDLNGKDNCTYRKPGVSEAQPDVSFYIGSAAEAIPWGTGIVNLDQYPSPDLVIEIASTSLSDDTGNKRLLYEDLGVGEYWIVDVQSVEIIAFAVENQGSRRIQRSQVLPGLDIAVLKTALQRSRNTNHGKVSAWLLEQFQQIKG